MKNGESENFVSSAKRRAADDNNLDSGLRKSSERKFGGSSFPTSKRGARLKKALLWTLALALTFTLFYAGEIYRAQSLNKQMVFIDGITLYDPLGMKNTNNYGFVYHSDNTTSFLDSYGSYIVNSFNSTNDLYAKDENFERIDEKTYVYRPKKSG